MARTDIVGSIIDPSSAAAELAKAAQTSVVLVHTEGAGAGSGIVWPGENAIITNSHVIPWHSATVQASDGTTVRAEVVRRDPIHDLALLAVPTPIAPPVSVRISPPLRTGELVFAVGHPLGLRNVVTAGIVSASGGQPWPGREGIRDAIQAHIRLLPGNSGGPLLDAEGHVVGVNAMVVGGGLALSIPSRTVQRFIDNAELAYLGVATRLVDLRWAGTRQSEPALLVVEVGERSPAAQAGLQVGDILLEADGKRLSNPTALVGLLDERQAGQTIDLRVVRGGRTISITAQLAQRPA